jgi:isopenicillin N synthase-like dioxygenase
MDRATDSLIPLLDFRDWTEGSPERREAFVAQVGAALETYGFVSIEGHGVPDPLVAEAYAAAREVFALPDEALRVYERPEVARQRGYTPLFLEKAKDRSAADLKAFWHVGRDLPPDHPLADLMPANAFPDPLVPEFGRSTRALFAALEGFALQMLDVIARHLGVPPDGFRDLVRDGNSVLRVIHYPDLDGPAPVGAVRAAAHEDINLLTVLPAATRPGLELLTRDGMWMPVTAPPGVLVCDTGDMMQLLTGGRLPATTHRVVNPSAQDGGRLSMPFFLHPRPDAMLTPLWGDAPPKRAHDFLLERLVANNVA